jgi:signal transduction histidine kinase
VRGGGHRWRAGDSAEYAHKIFDRFAQVPGAEAGKAGLGLALAAEIAKVHGGELRLANPGQPGRASNAGGRRAPDRSAAMDGRGLFMGAWFHRLRRISTNDA